MRAQVSPQAARSFAMAVLRGVGQVMLQDNAATGLLFLAGIFVSSWICGLYALLGTVVATAAGFAFGASDDDVRHGMYGFNGTLTGVALAVYFQHDATLVAIVILAAITSTIVMAAIAKIAGASGRALTAPFVLTTWIFAGAAFSFSRLHTTPALEPPHVSHAAGAAALAWSGLGAAGAVVNGVAQVMLQQGAWTGVIFLIAIAIHSRKSLYAALLGSAIALGFAWSLGAEPHALRAGLYGFNAVLTAIALWDVFFRINWVSVLIGVVGVCVSALLFGAMTLALAPLGIPVITAPFVITTWLCLLAGGKLSRLLPPALDPAAVPALSAVALLPHGSNLAQAKPEE